MGYTSKHMEELQMMRTKISTYQDFDTNMR